MENSRRFWIWVRQSGPGEYEGAATERPSKFFYTKTHGAPVAGTRALLWLKCGPTQWPAQLGKGLRVEVRKAVMRSRMDERR